MKAKSRLRLAICPLLLALGAFCANAAGIDRAIQRELVVISTPHAYDLNPHTASYASEAQVLSGLYEGLFSYHPYTLEPEPALAESFKISRNKLTWTITLRKGARFSNGEPITAQSVKDSWLALIDPQLNAPFASLFDCVKGVPEYRAGKAKKADDIGVTVKDENTLVIKLNTPTEHFAKLLCHHAFAVVHPDLGVYSGAFVLAEYDAAHILLQKNPLYWDGGSVALPAVRFLLSDNQENNTYLFNTGKAQWVNASIDSSKVLVRNALQISSQFGTEYLFFKSGKKPFSDERVRNALIYALPQDELRSNSLIQAATLVLPLSGYPEILGTPEQDLEEAASLLKSAGYGGKSRKLSVTVCFTDDDASKRRAELLSDAWKQIGVETKAIFKSSEEYMSALEGQGADLFSYIWIGDFADPLAFLELFRSTSSLNVTEWKNAKYDALIEEAAAITDAAKRYAKLAEAEQLLLDSGVIYPVSHTVSFNVLDVESVGGWFDNALDIHPLKYIRFVQPEIPANVALNAE